MLISQHIFYLYDKGVIWSHCKSALSVPRPFQHAWRWPATQWQWGQWERASKLCISCNSWSPFESNFSDLLILTCFFFPFPRPPPPCCECLDPREASFHICTAKVPCAGFSHLHQCLQFSTEGGNYSLSTSITSSWERGWVSQLKESTCLIFWKLYLALERLTIKGKSPTPT